MMPPDHPFLRWQPDAQRMNGIQQLDWDALGTYFNLRCVRTPLCLWERLMRVNPNSVRVAADSRAPLALIAGQPAPPLPADALQAMLPQLGWRWLRQPLQLADCTVRQGTDLQLGPMWQRRRQQYLEPYAALPARRRLHVLPTRFPLPVCPCAPAWPARCSRECQVPHWAAHKRGQASAVRRRLRPGPAESGADNKAGSAFLAAPSGCGGAMPVGAGGGISAETRAIVS
jgi:hypothetical protein